MYDMILIIFFRLLSVNNISYVLLDFSVGSTYAHAVSKGLAKEEEKDYLLYSQGNQLNDFKSIN